MRGIRRAILRADQFNVRPTLIPMPASARFPGGVSGGVICAVLLYVGIYSVLVIPAPLDAMTGLPPWPRIARYRFGGKGSELLFYPASYIDRKLFTRRWLYTAKDAHFPGA
jgi:hypothetical protein